MDRTPNSLFRAMVVLAALGGSCFLSGCASVGGDPFAIFEAGRKEHDVRPGESAYAVEFYRDGVQIDKYIAPLQGQMTVEDALKEARVHHQFGRIKVTLLRGKQRMNVEYKNSRRAVEAISNYQLYAYDRILVEPDPRTMLDDALQSLDTPMAQSMAAPLK
jgi:hypothetical protein